MTSKLFRLGSCSIVAIGMAGMTPAFAAGTTAGTSITNTATVNYNVGSTAQPQVQASDTFVVDRKINVTVAEVGNSATIVAPGQTGAVTTFTVQNNSNQTLDFALTASQGAGGAGIFSNTDNFNVTSPLIYKDTNGNGTYDAGTDTAVTYLDELAPDAIATVFIVANIPTTQVTNDAANVYLTATAHDGGAAGTLGTTTAETPRNQAQVNSTMETVFADVAGPVDGARDGAHSAGDEYLVKAAALTVTKFSTIISDPINNTTNPRMIPGSTVEYCITVANAAGGVAASNVAISDVVPSNLTYIAGSVKLNGTVNVGPPLTCNTDGGAGGTYTAGTTTVAGTIASIPAGETHTLVFRATVN